MTAIADRMHLGSKSSSSGGSCYHSTGGETIPSPTPRRNPAARQPSGEAILQNAQSTLSRQAYAWEVALASSIDATIDSRLVKLCEEIDELGSLPANWDGEDALPVTRDVLSHAKQLLRVTAEAAGAMGLRWHPPSLAPTPDGGLELSWEVGKRWAMLTLRPSHQSVECSAQEDGSPPRYQLESVGDAIQRVIWALRSRQGNKEK
jgi:hypothetical protein